MLEILWTCSGLDTVPSPLLDPSWVQRSHTTKLFGTWGTLPVTTPLWPSVRVKPNTSKVGDLESSGILECLEFDSKA
jgi:hypothetical protein